MYAKCLLASPITMSPLCPALLRRFSGYAMMIYGAGRPHRLAQVARPLKRECRDCGEEREEVNSPSQLLT